MAAITDALKKILPTILTVAPLGGPLAAMAANTVSKIIGVDVPPTPEGINDAIAAAAAKDPDIMLKLKEADQGFQLQMEQLGIKKVEDLAELTEKDRENARAREIAVRDKTPRNLAFIVVALTMIGEGYAFIHGVPGIDPMVVGRVLGTLDSALMLVLSYYFGSSNGSDAKNSMIADLVKQK